MSPNDMARALATFAASGRIAPIPLGVATTGPKLKPERITAMAADPAIGSVSYLRAGQPGGPRAIFIHGTPGAATDWKAFLAAVPPGMEYIAIDRPGFGPAGSQAAQPSLVRQAKALCSLLLETPRRPTVLVGHSYGVPVAVQAAILNPTLVDRLILLAGALDPDLERVHPLQPLARWWGIRRLLPRALRNANEELLALKAELERLQLGLHLLTRPVTILHGVKDRLVPFANMAWMQQQFSGVPVLDAIALADEDHFLPWTQQKRIAALVEAALQS